MRTRSRAQMEEAAHILAQLSQHVEPATEAAPPEEVQPVSNALPYSPNASPHASPIQAPQQAPQQAHPPVHRSLSHSEEAHVRAEAIAPYTTPGDTILMNFFVDRNGFATVQYMKNENGTMVIHMIEDEQENITIPWTFVATDFAL